MYKLIALFFAMSVFNSYSQNSPNVSIIPEPASIQFNEGSFTILPTSTLYFNEPEIIPDIAVFNSYMLANYGFRLSIKKAPVRPEVNARGIYFFLNKSKRFDSYSLKVDSSGIVLEGGSGAGIFYGIQTLQQMLPPGKNTLRIPAVSIEDQPRFMYRGMHLDVARHFFPVDAVKRYIDKLAMYKFNYLHWHLTDDQGWRIEIKKYPLLQSVSAWRNGTLIGHYHDQPAVYDTIRYGGYYTQDEIKDVVKYAQQRHITIIPEIEMPGHAQAVLAAYPNLSCTSGPFEVGRTWGVYKDVFCPKEETFKFLEDVLDEVCDLFPGKYIHIGGDECPKDRWKESKACQQFIKLENLKDENGIQRYFTNRMVSYLRKKNKTAIGWDEILEEGLDSQAVVMSWRGYNGGVDAAVKGHDVIMAPASHVYFDMYQSRNTGGRLAIGGYLPLDVVYNFEPVPDVLKADQAQHILGAQANVWTEYITNEERLNEMIFPRICALSEVLWTPKSKRDYISFARKMLIHFKMLHFLKINYSTALYDITAHVMPYEGKGLSVELSTMFPQGEIHYTIDGTAPKISSPVYNGKIILSQTLGIHAALFESNEQRGDVFSQVYYINKATGKPVTLKNQPHVEYSRGGAMALVDGATGLLPWIPSEWLGFQGTDLDASIDLGSMQTVSIVSVDVLKDEEGKIYLPSEVKVFTSTDGIKFNQAAMIDATKINSMQRKLRLNFSPVDARYIQVVAKNASANWLFVDEISVE